MRTGAHLTTASAFGSYCHEIDGMGRTMGAAKTRDTLAIGLWRMYPAQTAKSMISRVRINTRLSVA